MLHFLRAALAAALCALSPPAGAGETLNFTLSAPASLVESGLIRHLAVRFTLKTRRRAEMTDGPADLTIGARGVPVVARGDQLWRAQPTGENPAAQLFVGWLTGEAGRATIAAFPAEPPFAPPPEQAAAEEIPEFDGDPVLGEQLARTNCGRCHATGRGGGYGALDSTPSFAALRALPDWPGRFMAFYALNPHPAIMQVEGVSPPFDPDRPPPIHPVRLTQAQAEAIQAYAATVPAADLGAPVEAR